MELIWQGVLEALRLIISGDPGVLRITWLSIQISGAATFLSVVVGIPAGVGLALARFPGRGLLVALVNTGMGLPPVVVGLFVSIFLWRSGPLGGFELLYTPTAIVIAQFVIAAPIVTGLTAAAMQQLNPKLRLQFMGLGASRGQVLWLLIGTTFPAWACGIVCFGLAVAIVRSAIIVAGPSTASGLRFRPERFSETIRPQSASGGCRPSRSKLCKPMPS